MKKTKIITTIAGICLSALLVAGCGSAGAGGKTEYVQALLDNAYGVDSKAYAGMMKIDESKAEEYTKQSMDAEAAYMASCFKMENPSEKVLKIFADFADKMYEKVSYTVEADGDKVKVTVKPLELRTAAQDDLTAFVDDFNVRKFVDADASCTDEAFAQGIVDVLTPYLEQAETGDEVTVSLTVEGKKGAFEVSNEELNEVDEALIK